MKTGKLLTASAVRKVVVKRNKRTDGKQTLLLAALCRTPIMWCYLGSVGQEAVEAAEKFAKGLIPEWEVNKAYERIKEVFSRTLDRANEGDYQGTHGVKMGREVFAREAAMALVSGDLDNASTASLVALETALEKVSERKKLMRVIRKILSQPDEEIMINTLDT
jgi:hypothetical protein